MQVLLLFMRSWQGWFKDYAMKWIQKNYLWYIVLYLKKSAVLRMAVWSIWNAWLIFLHLHYKRSEAMCLVRFAISLCLCFHSLNSLPVQIRWLVFSFIFYQMRWRWFNLSSCWSVDMFYLVAAKYKRLHLSFLEVFWTFCFVFWMFQSFLAIYPSYRPSMPQYLN